MEQDRLKETQQRDTPDEQEGETSEWENLHELPTDQ